MPGIDGRQQRAGGAVKSRPWFGRVASNDVFTSMAPRRTALRVALPMARAPGERRGIPPRRGRNKSAPGNARGGGGRKRPRALKGRHNRTPRGATDRRPGRAPSGLGRGCMTVPRALPWAGLLRPLRGEKRPPPRNETWMSARAGQDELFTASACGPARRRSPASCPRSPGLSRHPPTQPG
jgi:hypothetical protein